MLNSGKGGLRLAAAALAAAYSVAGGAAHGSPAEAPDAVKNGDGGYNILLITTDQERYFDQYPQGTSYKARELLAELGTTFEKHYTCANMSTSSRSVIYTGLHIPQTRLLDNTDVAWQQPLSTEMTTVGDRLREAGYHTAFKGKWHMGGGGILGLHEDNLTDLEEYGFSDWGGTDYVGTLYEGLNADPIIASEAVEWLEGTGMALNGEGRSFFLAVNMVNPHDIMNYDDSGYQSGLLALGGKPDSPVYDRTYDDPAPSSWDFDLSAPDVPEAQKERLCQGLPGSSLMDLMDGSRQTVREGALFCYESLLMSAVQVDVALDGSMSYQIDLTNRGMVRGLITEDYKFVRYFSPLEFNTPQTLEELYALNDVQLFDLRRDPQELNNLAADPEANGELILELNAQLNRLIEAEIGRDDGQEVAAVLQAFQAGKSGT